MRLTDHDASFLYGETASGPMHGCGVVILDGEITFDEYLAFNERRIHLAPRFRQRLVYVPLNAAHPKWVDDPYFDLRNHIKPYRVPEGSTIDEAVKIALELCEPLLDRNRSLWLTYVMEGVPGHTLLVQMVHHAMIDGASGVDLSMVMTDLEPNALPPGPPNEKWEPAPLPGPAALWNEAVAENAEKMFAGLAPTPRSPANERLLRRGTEIMQRFTTEPVITAPWNAGTVGPKRLHRWTKYSFADFREIRRQFGGTINDVVLTVVTEAAARYLRGHGENIDGQYMRLMCPVNVRREGEEGTLGNRVSAMYPVLPAWPMDVGERLTTVCDETERLKSNKEPQALELMMESQPFSPPTAMAQTLLVGGPFDPTAPLARNPLPVAPRFGPRPPLIGYNFTCTNVPGVQVPQYVAGKQLIATLGTLMLGGTLGYGVAVGSYNQELFFNLTSDPRLLPDLDKMLEGIEDSFNDLLGRAQAKSA